MIFASLWRNAKSIPGSHAIHADLTRRDILLQSFKRRAQPRVKLFAPYDSKLRFGIVNVVNIDARQLHISQRLVQLIVQIGRGHAVAATHDILEARDAGFDECLLDVTSYVSRWCAVEWQISAFGTDDDFISREAAIVCQLLQRRSDRSLASLKTIVGGSVDDVGA